MAAKRNFARRIAEPMAVRYWRGTRAVTGGRRRPLAPARLASLVAVALVLGLLAAGPASASAAAHHRYAKIDVVGEEPLNGVFDASVEYGDDGIGWLAYSRAEVPGCVETHLARSIDHGRTWSYVGAANRCTEGSMTVDGRVLRGLWRYETPTLLFDAGDVPARRWKLFAQRYFVVAPYKKGDRLFGHGWIEYRYASSPTGPWSEPVRLFGKTQDNCRVDLSARYPDLRAVEFFGEPGSVVVDGTIYLSLDASTTATGLGDWAHRKIILVSSPDHGATWRYVGVLSDYADASALGYRALTGSSLVSSHGGLFLLVTPAGAKGLFRRNRGHDGTLVMQFDDIGRARLKRDGRGRLVVLKTFKPELDSGGLSDYDDQNTWGGMLICQINMEAKPEVFQIFSTRQGIVGEQ
jgi:hypothetical protein